MRSVTKDHVSSLPRGDPVALPQIDESRHPSSGSTINVTAAQRWSSTVKANTARFDCSSASVAMGKCPMQSPFPNLYVKDTGSAKGRGVYAARPHADGELIEACPVVLFSGSFADIPDEIRKLLFNWGVL